MENFINEIKEMIGENITVLKMDNTIQEAYKQVLNTNCWDFITDGNTLEYLESGYYVYSGLGEDFDIDVYVEFEVVEIIEDDIIESIIKITNIY